MIRENKLAFTIGALLILIVALILMARTGTQTMGPSCKQVPACFEVTPADYCTADKGYQPMGPCREVTPTK